MLLEGTMDLIIIIIIINGCKNEPHCYVYKYMACIFVP